MSSRAAPWVIALACCALLAACRTGWGGRTVRQDVVVGQELATAEITDAQGAPPLPRSRALAVSERQVPTWPVATEVSARYVTLTIRDVDGAVAGDVRARPVWLVTFVGAAFLPANAPQPGCPCKGYYQRSDTVVAVDARTGTPVVVYGVNGSGRGP